MNVFEITREIKFDFVNIVHRLITCEVTQMQFVSHKSFSAAQTVNPFFKKTNRLRKLIFHPFRNIISMIYKMEIYS